MDDRDRSAAARGTDSRRHQNDGGFGTPAGMYRDMLEDLDEEIRASDKQRPVLAGEVSEELDTQPPYYRYALAMRAPLPPFRAETYVKLLLDESVVMRAQVESASGERLVIATLTPIPRARWWKVSVIPDDRWLLERLRDAVLERQAEFDCGAPSDEFDHGIAQRAIGRTLYEDNVVPAPCLSESDLEAILERLNEGQRDAVLKALRARAFYLSGPPGTGKSTTIAAYVEAHVRAGRRVLVVAPSNPATDVLTRTLAERLRAVEGFTHGRILIRVGPRPTKVVREELGACVIPSRVAARLVAAEYGALRARVAGEVRQVEATLSSTAAGSQLARRTARQRKLHSSEADALASAETAAVAARVRRLLDEARVVVTPIQNIYLSPSLVAAPFDVVVVDECSMVTLQQLCLTAGKARLSVLAAGDHMQLPAPVARRNDGRVPNLADDVFEAAGLTEAIDRDEDLPHLALLTVQHRMARPICDLVSDLFYDSRLEPAVEVRRRAPVTWPWSRRSVLLVDTGALEPEVERGRGSGSRLVRAHAAATRAIVQSLAESEPGEDRPLLVLSGFTAQVEAIRDTLRRPTPARADVRVSTIHRAQGQEAHSVIVSIDEASGAPVSPFFRGSAPHGLSRRILNVALSRARDRLLILGSVEWLEAEGGAVVRALVHRLQNDGCVIDVRDVVAVDDIFRGSLRAPDPARRRQAAARSRTGDPADAS